MSNIAIEVKNVSKVYKLYEDNRRRIIEGLFPFIEPKYKEFKALNNIDFTIKKGEIVGIIGRNGSGKSTLLKIITGVLNASTGHVNVNGRICALLELGAGFNPEYTGIENIYLSGTLNRITREEMSLRIKSIEEFADIGDFIHQPIKNYSSGMFVRLAFAVAVYSNPDILIVDEALAVGDAAFQAKCMARMNQIMKSGATVLFVTHDMNTVKRLCQRCIYLENGVKIMEGPAEDLADIYLKRIRATMNEEHIIINKEILQEETIKVQEKCQENKDFIEKTKMFAEGNGDVEFIDLKLLDEYDEEIFAYEFNSKMKIQMKLKVNEDEEFTVGYHIRDDKNMELLGTSIKKEVGTMIQGKKGEIYEIEFITPLPVIEGNYNLTLVASKPIIANRTALFLALIENAAVFSVMEDPVSKLWNKCYVKNDVSIKKLTL